MIYLQLVTTHEAAEMLRVSGQHIRNMIKKGILKAYKEGRKGGYRIDKNSINNYAQKKIAREYFQNQHKTERSDA